jgi:GNAT superfamily N-acetyltransferase
MITQLHETDLDLVLDCNLRKLEASGRCKLPAAWRAHSIELYIDLYRNGKCLHLGYRAENIVVALAGALICDETPFLSTQTVRHGLIIDEYVTPEYRNRGIDQRLRQELLVWLAEKGARLSTSVPPNSARLSFAAGNLRW